MVWLRLNISNICNFSCKYCHVFNIRNNKIPMRIMSFKTMDYSIQQFIKIMKSFNQKDLTVSIYGGETLVNKKNLFQLIKKYKNQYESISINWIVNTNGSLLNNQDAQFLKKYNIDVHLSCDGYERIHNKNRIDKFGKGTFQKVKKALQLIKEWKLKSQINSFVMPENLYHLKDLINIANEYKINRIYLDILYNNKMMNHKEVLKKYIEAYFYGTKKGVRINGPWSRILNRYYKRYTIKDIYLPSINVNTDKTFFFNNYPLSKNFKLKLKNIKSIFSSKEFPIFLNSIKNYFKKKCTGCSIYDYCQGSGIQQYQYHVMKENGYLESCKFTRGIIKEILKNQNGINV